MLGNKDEKINANGIVAPDRADEFINTGIKKGRRRGRIILSQKLMVVALVIFLGGGFFSETWAQQLEFIPVLKDVYSSFYKKRNLDRSKVDNFNDNQIIEKKCNDVTITIKNFIYDDNEVILFYEVKSKKEYFDIGYYSITDENGKIGRYGGAQRRNVQLSKNEKNEFVVNGIFNQEFIDNFINTDTTNGDKIIFAFDLWSKTEMDNLQDKDLANNRQIPKHKYNPSEFDISFEINKSEFGEGDSEIIDIYKKLQNDGFEFYIKKIELNPLSTVLSYVNKNYTIGNGYSISSINLTDGTKNYRQIGRMTCTEKYSDYELKFESLFFTNVDKLNITSYTIIQEHILNEKLKINFENKTVNEEYKEFLEIIDVVYDEEEGVWNIDLRWRDDINMWIQSINPQQQLNWIQDKKDFNKRRYFVYADRYIKEYEFNIGEIKEIGTYECNLKIK